MRIAQVAPLWASVPPASYGGIELVVHLLTEQLAGRGHDVTLFATGDSRTRARLEAAYPIPLTEAMRRGEARTYEHYVGSMVTKVVRESRRFDLVHLHVDTCWIPTATLAAAPALFTLHTDLGPDDAWVMAQHPTVAVVGISGSQVRAIAAVRPGTRVVHHGCDVSAYTPSFEPGSYLAFLGRMSAAKNPLDAIAAARRVGMPLVLAGAPGDRREQEYFDACVRPNVDGKAVRYVGPVNHRDKNDLLRHAAALLFPVAWDEPFGLVMIEAMACGTPVVAHERGSVAEIVDPGVTGFYGTPLGDLVPRALELDRRVVREHASRRFSAERMVDDYVEVYASLLRSRGRPP